MKHFQLRREFLLALVSVALLAGVSWRPPPAMGAQDEWPRRFEDPKGEVLVYQPQLEDFKDDKLWARAAVSARKKEWKAPVFGAVWINARVSVDRDSRMARIYEIKVTDAKFPSTSSNQFEEVREFINAQIEGDVESIALDRLVAAMDLVEKERAMDDNLRNEPPKIIYRAQPAMLVLLDGEPRLMPIPESTLMRVVNTPFVMLYLPTDKSYYLKAGETWAFSPALQGPWKHLETLPGPLQDIEERSKREAAKQAADQEGKVPQAKTGESEKMVDLTKEGDLPEIIVSTEPSELIVTEGEPQYTPIEHTNLLYVSNSENTIFMDTATRDYYVVLSGRWFKGGSLDSGPWSYVPSTGLPSDFAKIPEGSVKGFVLVNVAGTEQAREAVMDNYIPQTAAIDRNKASIEIQYDGEPKFEKIPNIDVEYAVNTQDAVFRVQGKYYACVQAVWYEASSPNGPWKVSVAVAEDVYKIPASNPHYNAKYVKVYDSTDDVAYVGYTPGYTGSYVEDGTVVYGTGYNYNSYYSTNAYIPYPTTYGYSAVYDPYLAVWGYQPVYYNPYAWLVPTVIGVGVGLAVAAMTDYWWDYPHYRYWGWWGPGGFYYHNVHYHHYDHYRHARWRPRHAPYWRPGDRPTWRPGDQPWRRGDRDRFRRDDRPGRPGDRLWLRPGEKAGRPGQLPALRPNLYSRPGMENKLVDASKVQRPGRRDLLEGRPGSTGPAEDGLQRVQPGAERAALERSGRKPADARGRSTRRTKPTTEQMKKNNVFTDQKGNIYRRDSKGNWQQRDAKRWSNVDRSPSDQVRQQGRSADRSSMQRAVKPAQRPSIDTGSLNREFRARERGAQRTHQFNRSQSFQPRSSFGHPSRSGGGSSFRGGGASDFRGGGGSSLRGSGSSFRGGRGSSSFGGGGGRISGGSRGATRGGGFGRR
ncbi:MAG: hypothetical protein GX422_10670 [Deltaproteobacteria bacterium]|nr:hypothetical protein [Deltaproteobacteria bacterium]